MFFRAGQMIVKSPYKFDLRIVIPVIPVIQGFASSMGIPNLSCNAKLLGD